MSSFFNTAIIMQQYVNHGFNNFNTPPPIYSYLIDTHNNNYFAKVIDYDYFAFWSKVIIIDNFKKCYRLRLLDLILSLIWIQFQGCRDTPTHLSQFALNYFNTITIQTLCSINFFLFHSPVSFQLSFVICSGCIAILLWCWQSLYICVHVKDLILSWF